MILEKRIPLTYMFNKMWKDILLSSCFVCIVVVIEHFYHFNIKLPVAIPAFLGTSISLLLAFKLSQSYDRWWEARKIWGAIVNDSRTLVLQLKSFTNYSNETKHVVKKVAYRQIGWCYALSDTLRKLTPLESLEGLLSSDEMEILKGHKNIPLKIIDLNSKDISELHSNETINNFQQIQLDQTLVRLCASMGKSERIKNTVFPRIYRVFLKFFIYIFIITLAISLTVHLNPFVEIGLLVTITLPFLLMERTAYYMQDPFENRPSDTPTLTISKTIEANLRQLLDEEDIAKEELTDSYYIL
ncbi:MAG: hypothetical protein COA38_10790 [Fluviicola sp.]|nr:MAG: hypothetical protein COA38_10790 [Fluviicola sp.]